MSATATATVCQRTRVIQNVTGFKTSRSEDYPTLTHTYAATAVALEIAAYLSRQGLDDVLDDIVDTAVAAIEAEELTP